MTLALILLRLAADDDESAVATDHELELEEVS